MIEKAKDSVSITSILNSYLENSVCILNMFQISVRNSFYFFNQSESPNDFCSNLFGLFDKEFLKIIFVKKRCLTFTFCKGIKKLLVRTTL